MDKPAEVYVVANWTAQRPYSELRVDANQEHAMSDSKGGRTWVLRSVTVEGPCPQCHGSGKVAI